MGPIILASNSNYIIEGGLALPRPMSEMKIAHITTASKGATSTESTIKRQQKMIDQGLNLLPLDIEGKTQEELTKLLSDRDMIFVDMGNTFYLLKAIKESGFDEVVKERIQEGATYLGASAGAYVACPNIEMATWKHPDVNRFGLIDLSAMNLVSFLVTAHYDPKNDELLRKSISECNYPVKVLSDSQAILFDGGEAKLIGEGEEIDLFRENYLYSPEGKLR